MSEYVTWMGLPLVYLQAGKAIRVRFGQEFHRYATGGTEVIRKPASPSDRPVGYLVNSSLRERLALDGEVTTCMRIPETWVPVGEGEPVARKLQRILVDELPAGTMIQVSITTPQTVMPFESEPRLRKDE